MVNHDAVSNEQFAEVGVRLARYKHETDFQAAIIQFIINYKATEDELTRMRNIFTQLDTDKDGVLSREEVSSGMDRIT